MEKYTITQWQAEHGKISYLRVKTVYSMNKYVSTILSILLVFALPVIAKNKKGELKKLLREAIANKKAQVGIAVIINGEDTITLNNKVRYP